MSEAAYRSWTARNWNILRASVIELSKTSSIGYSDNRCAILIGFHQWSMSSICYQGFITEELRSSRREFSVKHFLLCAVLIVLVALVPAAQERTSENKKDRGSESTPSITTLAFAAKRFQP